LRRQLAQLRQPPPGVALTSQDQQPAWQDARGTCGPQERLQVGRDDLESIDGMLLEIIGRALGVEGEIGRQQLQAASRGETGERAVLPRIGGERGYEPEAPPRPDVEPLDDRRHVPRSDVLDAHSLGSSRGSRRNK
jgi:hypothetical protein